MAAKLIDLYFYLFTVSEIKIYKYSSSFTFEDGQTLPSIEIAYTDEGDADAPVVWVCHAPVSYTHLDVYKRQVLITFW